MMTSSKRRKFDNENRLFKEEWKEQYAFILPTGSSNPHCLICSQSVALVKSSNLKRHYESRHGGFEKMYKQGTEERKKKIRLLVSQYEKSTMILANTMTAQEKATECSLRIAWILGKHKKPFTDAEVVKECMIQTAETLFDGKQRDEIIDKLKQIPLSDSTAMRRTELLAEDLVLQLDEGLKSAPCLSLAIDESTDMTDNAQLMVFARYYDGSKKKFMQELFGVAALKGRTQGEDIYDSLKSMMESRNIEMKSIISMTTDGAPAMLGKGRGLIGRLLKDNPNLISFHCIIHQAVLCASLGEEYREVMETIMKLVNFLRSTSALQHRLLRNFLSENNAVYSDLLVHNNIRWLSKGKVLERFWSIREELMVFLEVQNNVKADAFLAFLRDDTKMEIVGFLADMMSHLNELCLKLQGEKCNIFDLINAVHAFQKKLTIFKHDIQNQLNHFQRLLEQCKGKRDARYVAFIEKLIDNFAVRFGDFSLGKQLLLFIENPFLITNIVNFSAEAKETFKWVDVAKIQLELIEFQENIAVKEIFCNCTPETFWSKEGLFGNFPLLHQLAVQILTLFGSTYCCESAFSTMNFIKNKFRICMTNENLHDCVRIAITTLEPKFKELARNKKCHFSH